ncbi:MAG: hypothetical protein HY543_00865, partial [Deltaproteobacteria bacterium]|nr:hypothetical protein [Deltaproteobacteria bacterium]
QKSGEATLDIQVKAYGPDQQTAQARADAVKAKLAPLFKSWSYDVTHDVGGNDLAFSVKVR